MANVTVDQSKCIGCGLCASTCPAVFEISEETQKSHVIEGADCAKAGCCQEAADGCPAGAISLGEQPEKEAATPTES